MYFSLSRVWVLPLLMMHVKMFNFSGTHLLDVSSCFLADVIMRYTMLTSLPRVFTSCKRLMLPASSRVWGENQTTHSPGAIFQPHLVETDPSVVDLCEWDSHERGEKNADNERMIWMFKVPKTQPRGTPTLFFFFLNQSHEQLSSGICSQHICNGKICKQRSIKKKTFLKRFNKLGGHLHA